MTLRDFIALANDGIMLRIEQGDEILSELPSEYKDCLSDEILSKEVISYSIESAFLKNARMAIIVEDPADEEPDEGGDEPDDGDSGENLDGDSDEGSGGDSGGDGDPDDDSETGKPEGEP